MQKYICWFTMFQQKEILKMKMSKEVLKQIREAKCERALVNVLRKIVKEYVSLDDKIWLLLKI